ncbi:MAG TPA: Dyp-type peroxidase [Stellaceae bacterium]|nr:Dyp-type peroxidase [Stellaceae bacterium]
MTPDAPDRPPPASQPIATPLTRAAIFLVVTINPGEPASDAVRSLCADFPALVRTAGFRDLEGHLSCVMGFGSGAWDRLFSDGPRPTELHPFREFHAENRHAIATPGDILFHIRAERMDLCFEMESLIMASLGDAVTVADEVQGFQYFDNRDLLGFVDGTENPEGQDAVDAVLIGGEDPEFAGGSYVVIQKYLHDMAGWNALPTEMQERIIGRTKFANADLDTAVKPTSAHNALTIIVENGVEVKIVRCNMPFGQPGQGEFGTFFIGYSKSPRTIEQMLENMFVGRPPGNYDRLLNFSRAVTGNLFFVPAASLLDILAAAPEAPAVVDAAPNLSPARDGSLAIGSLKGNPQ